jgi:hypothetical protein
MFVGEVLAGISGWGSSRAVRTERQLAARKKNASKFKIDRNDKRELTS